MPSCGKDVSILGVLVGIFRACSWVQLSTLCRSLQNGRKTHTLCTVQLAVIPRSFQHTKISFLQIQDSIYPRFPQSLYLLTLHKNLKGF